MGGLFRRSEERRGEERCAPPTPPALIVLGEKSSRSRRARGQQGIPRVVLSAVRSGTAAAMKPVWGLGLLCVLLLAGEWGRGFSNLPRVAVEAGGGGLWWGHARRTSPPNRGELASGSPLKLPSPASLEGAAGLAAFPVATTLRLKGS